MEGTVTNERIFAKLKKVTLNEPPLDIVQINESFNTILWNGICRCTYHLDMIHWYTERNWYLLLRIILISLQNEAFLTEDRILNTMVLSIILNYLIMHRMRTQVTEPNICWKIIFQHEQTTNSQMFTILELKSIKFDCMFLVMDFVCDCPSFGLFELNNICIWVE